MYLTTFLFEDKQDYSVNIEDDGVVAFAYLIEADENIISHLWLYNSFTPDNNSELRLKEGFAPQNPKEYILYNIDPIQNDDDVSVEWVNLNEYIRANIYIHNKFIGYIDNENRIGFNYLVTEDSPIAKKA